MAGLRSVDTDVTISIDADLQEIKDIKLP
ncbi:hypothetical protein M2D86_25460 [Klebsiella pneumoniae]|nr:hypothetical protein [Klebsiella pneumoniae]